MDADHHEAASEALLEQAEFLDDAKAVDTAECPEVEDHDSAAKLSQGKGILRVDPATGPAELGRANTTDRRRHLQCIIPRSRLSAGRGAPNLSALI